MMTHLIFTRSCNATVTVFVDSSTGHVHGGAVNCKRQKWSTFLILPSTNLLPAPTAAGPHHSATKIIRLWNRQASNDPTVTLRIVACGLDSQHSITCISMQYTSKWLKLSNVAIIRTDPPPPTPQSGQRWSKSKSFILMIHMKLIMKFWLFK